MRKHFLILMLMALLPLAGWAALPPTHVMSPTNISTGWKVALYVGGDKTDRATYTGAPVAPHVVLVDEGEDNYIDSEDFNFQWKDGNGNEISADQIINVIPGGNYTVTVSSNDDVTYGTIPAAKATASFWVTKATPHISGGNEPTLPAVDQPWTGSPLNLLGAEGALDDDFNHTAAIEYSIDGGTTWATGMPTATKTGTYPVSYRVQGTDNYKAIAKVDLGETKILGTDFTPADHINAPTAKDGLAFTWDATNKKGVAKDLINPGSLKGDAAPNKGSFMYKVDDTEGWISTVPQRSDAGTYHVSWKVVASKDFGYNDYTPVGTIDVEIAKATPVINPTAAAATSLTYPGDAAVALALLSAEGTATMGATVKYQIQAPGGAFGAAVAYADVKGKAAGDWKIKPVIEASTNYNEVIPADDAALVVTATIAKAQAFTAAPTAKADLTWTGADQQLIEAGAGTISGKVEYQLDGGAWTTAIADIKATPADNYEVKYRVTDANYEAVDATVIAGTKIAPATVSIIVNNASKKYDATGAINALTPATTKFAVTNAVEGQPVSVALLEYTNEGVGLGDEYKNAGTYEKALTTTAAAVKALNLGYGDNYEYTIVPGNLIVEPRPIYVEANGSNATFGVAYDLSKDYTIKGGEAGDVDASAATAEQIANYFTTAPILTAPTATGTPVPVDEYELAFTAGTTAANYTMDLTKGENNDGYFINGQKFTVAADPTHKLVITVKPHTQTYTGVAESWAVVNEGTDYEVSGLIEGDAITKKPTFTRSNDTKFDADVYTLTASGAEVTNLAAHYPGGIIYNNSTFTIEPAEVTVTVNPQTITTEANTVVKANAALDQDAWTVTGLVGPDATTGKSVLGGTLAVNTTTAGTEDGQEKAVIPSLAAIYGWGIQFAKTNTNYTIKENTQYGELRVIATTTIELVDTEDMTTDLKAANNSTTASITFNSRTLKEDTWNTLILPFDIKVRDLSDALGYAVVDMLDVNNADKSKVIFKITTGTIPANTPFMVKTDANVNLQSVLIAANAEMPVKYTDETTGVAADAAGNKLTGAYKPQTVNDGEYYMNGSGNWKKYEGTGFEIKGERVKFTKAAATSAAPTFYIEEGDGTMTVINGETTAIETISAEKLNAAEGWYTLNGVKLQSMPTQKGIYINNGKKVVIK